MKTMRIRLKTRWGSRLPGSECNVSVERAKALEADGIAKALEPYPEPEKKGKKAKEKPEDNKPEGDKASAGDNPEGTPNE